MAILKAGGPPFRRQFVGRSR
ncbi:hypothetical protein STIAU_6283, partial [Stigmatella aurantiaca DW4/3-1]